MQHRAPASTSTYPRESNHVAKPRHILAALAVAALALTLVVLIAPTSRPSTPTTAPRATDDRTSTVNPEPADSLPPALAAIDLAPALEALALNDALDSRTLARITASINDPPPDVSSRPPGVTVWDLAPEEILPRLLATSDGFFRDHIATDLAMSLAYSRTNDPQRHRELSLAALLACELVLQSPSIPDREKTSFCSIVGYSIFETDPTLREFALRRATTLIAPPSAPDAAYAVLLENQLKFYAKQRDPGAFEAVAAAWQTVAWPQRPADRAWRDQKLARLRASSNF